MCQRSLNVPKEKRNIVALSVTSPLSSPTERKKIYPNQKNLGLFYQCRRRNGRRKYPWILIFNIV